MSSVSNVLIKNTQLSRPVSVTPPLSEYIPSTPSSPPLPTTISLYTPAPSGKSSPVPWKGSHMDSEEMPRVEDLVLTGKRVGRDRAQSLGWGGHASIWNGSAVSTTPLPTTATDPYALNVSRSRSKSSSAYFQDGLWREERVKRMWESRDADTRRSFATFRNESPVDENLPSEPLPPTYENIDDYFNNTEYRTKAWVNAEKNLEKEKGGRYPIYVVEFKAGRHDFFTYDSTTGPIVLGDLVVVEADRGKDLGKVIFDSIFDMQQLEDYRATRLDLIADSQFTSKQIHPKRILHLASPTEISLLVPKSQDEAKAISISQSKIRSKQLPMQLVDAEYQWDRKKLTFYFVAEGRIDFRELVRDLFKIYKTRIWMCAVNPAAPFSL